MFCLSVYAIDSHWSKVLGADIIAGPITFNDRVYVATEDRSISCLDSTGRFLWNHALPGKTVPFLAVSPTGIVLAFCEKGNIIAFNSNGSFLWKRVEKQNPVYEPIFGLDGRIFFVFKDSVLCMYSSSLIKWTAHFSTLHIDSTPQICGLSGEGDLLIITTDGQYLRFSPYGELKERCLLEELGIANKMITHIQSVPGGFVAGTSAGDISFFDIRTKTELLWISHLSNSLSGMAYGEGSLFTIASNGNIDVLNLTDGTLLWTDTTEKSLSGIVDTVWDYGQFNVTAAGFAGAWSIDGRQLRRQILPLEIKNPVLSSSGFIYAALSQWRLECWRLETWIKTEKKTKKTQSYGILNTTDSSWIQYLPEAPGYILSLFKEIDDLLIKGKVGVNEGFYARELSRILVDTKRPSIERARAAALLGQLGSSEYRSLLLDFCYGPFDPTLAEGLLWGLASCATDPDGLSLAAVAYLIRTAGNREKGVLLAGCDSLYALIRYAQEDRAIEGTLLLASFLEPPYDNVLANRARLLLARLLNI